MSMPDVERGIYQALVAASAVTDLVNTRIYNLQGPDSAILPYLVFYLGGGGMQNTNPTEMTNTVYRIEAIGTTRAEMRNVFEAVKTTLHNQRLSLTGWNNYWMALENFIDLVDNISGKQYFRRVGDFRIRTDKS